MLNGAKIANGQIIASIAKDIIFLLSINVSHEGQNNILHFHFVLIPLKDRSLFKFYFRLPNRFNLLDFLQNPFDIFDNIIDAVVIDVWSEGQIKGMIGNLLSHWEILGLITVLALIILEPGQGMGVMHAGTHPPVL